MSFNSQELGVKLAGKKKESEKCSGEDSAVSPAVCTLCSNCTGESQKNPAQQRKGGKGHTEHKRGPGKKKGGSYAAGLELLRTQLRESLGSAAR